MKTTNATWMGRTMGAAMALAVAASPALAGDRFEAVLRELPRVEGVADTRQSFGLHEQATVIPVLDYMAVSHNTEYAHRPDGYVIAPGSQLAVMWTAVPLQHGVNLNSVCFDFHDSNPSADIIVGLLVTEAGQQGSLQPELVSLASVGATGSAGYGRSCLTAAPAPFPFGIRSFGDASGDGDQATLQYFLIMAVPADGSSALGAITLRWQRQVGPAPATAGFLDVPTTHPQFRFVEALALSGITSGCGNGRFCPDAPLTRGQMAVFLSVALGLHWPN